MRRLDLARSNKRYAGGTHEIWPLALDGRIATLIVDIIETFLQHGGASIIFSSNTLIDHQRIAAILRYWHHTTNETSNAMKTSHRIAATLVTAIALASCTGGTDTNDDTDQPDITTDTNVDDDEPDTSVEDDESDTSVEDDESED